MTITNSGTAPLRTAARDESTLCSANVISANGMAMLITPMTKRWPYDPRLAGQRLAGDRDDRRQEHEADQQPEHDQRERLEAVVDADLDEEIAAAPEEAEEHEEQPVESGRGGGHGNHGDASPPEVKEPACARRTGPMCVMPNETRVTPAA